jgi:hypothetical protein
MENGWMPTPKRSRWRALLEWLMTARCQGCPNRVRLVGNVFACRRESAYCQACLSLERRVN